VGSEQGQGVPRAFGKAVWRWPPGFAEDAGTMQIQLWGRIGVNRGEAASWSTAPHAASQETGKGEHGSAGLTVKRLSARISFAARRKGAKRQDMRGRVGWRELSSCRWLHPGRRAK
jgi:hypothetical protein